jgi:GAF domain-containing protein
MTREADVVRSLVDLADTLVADYDVVDLLTGLADRCVHVLGVAAAGVMLASPGGDLRLVASSSETMRVLELFELQAREGPCLDAFRTGDRVEHENLRPGSGRWPRFSTVAVEAGFQSAFALPLRLRDTTIGALNLVGFERTPMDEADVLVARAFADLATISVLQHRAATDSQRVNEQLTNALTSRIVIEQAKGVVFERASIDMPETFTRLRTYARKTQPPPHRCRSSRHRRHPRSSGVGRNAAVEPVVAARHAHRQAPRGHCPSARRPCIGRG